jgi:hypothetical protein
MPNNTLLLLTARKKFKEITLVPPPVPTTWDVGVQTTDTNQTFSIDIASGTDPDITVDWGDETVQNFTTTGVKTRTYANSGTYIVKISGSFASGGNIRLGDTTAERARVQSTSVIPTIPGLTSFAGTFFDCFSLTSIPAGLFDNNTAVTDFANTFRDCSSLTSIPAGLFDNNTAVTSFAGTFHRCSFLTTIPAGLFDNNTAVTNFSNTFEVCFGLTTTSIPAGLFANNTAVTSFSSTFRGCISLTSIPAGLFANNTAVTDFSSTFRNCSDLTTIPAGLFANNTAVTNFGQTFLSCSDLTTVPAGLFANNTAVTSFAGTFGSVTLTTESYSNLLIDMASNAASRLNDVPFGGGNSKYNIDGQTARSTLTAKNWAFTDGGLE